MRGFGPTRRGVAGTDTQRTGHISYPYGAERRSVLTAVVAVLFLLGVLTATATAASEPAPVPGTHITVLVTATPLAATLTAEALATRTPTVTATVQNTLTPTHTITPTGTARPPTTVTPIITTPTTAPSITTSPITATAITASPFTASPFTASPNPQPATPASTLTTTGTPTPANLVQPLFTPASTAIGTPHVTPSSSPAASGTAQTTATGTVLSTSAGTPAIAMGLGSHTTVTTTVTTTTTTTATGTAKTTATASMTPMPSATPVVAHPPGNTALNILGPPTQIPASAADIANGASPAIALIALRHLGEVSRSDGVPWAGWCEMFVDNVAAEAGVSHARFPNALTDLYAGPLFQGHAPAGSLVFFDQRSSVDGHVGIALGDGTMISALSAGIVRTTYEDWSSYIGWRPYQGIGNGIATRLGAVQLAVEIAIPKALAPVPLHSPVVTTVPSVSLPPAQLP